MAARPNVQTADVAARMACKANAESIRTTQPMMPFAAEPLERHLQAPGDVCWPSIARMATSKPETGFWWTSSSPRTKSM